MSGPRTPDKSNRPVTEAERTGSSTSLTGIAALSRSSSQSLMSASLYSVSRSVDLTSSAIQLGQRTFTQKLFLELNKHAQYEELVQSGGSSTGSIVRQTYEHKLTVALDGDNCLYNEIYRLHLLMFLADHAKKIDDAIAIDELLHAEEKHNAFEKLVSDYDAYLTDVFTDTFKATIEDETQYTIEYNSALEKLATQAAQRIDRKSRLPIVERIENELKKLGESEYLTAREKNILLTYSATSREFKALVDNLYKLSLVTINAALHALLTIETEKYYSPQLLAQHFITNIYQYNAELMALFCWDNNQVLVQKIKSFALENGVDAIEYRNIAECQSAANDRLFLMHYLTGSFSKDLFHFIIASKLEYQPFDIRVTLNPLTVTDIQHDLSSGATYNDILHKKNNGNRFYDVDSRKVPHLFMVAQDSYAKRDAKKVTVILADDNVDINTGLTNFFAKHSRLLPPVTVHILGYDGRVVSNNQLVGTGDGKLDCREAVKLMCRISREAASSRDKIIPSTSPALFVPNERSTGEYRDIIAAMFDWTPEKLETDFLQVVPVLVESRNHNASAGHLKRVRFFTGSNPGLTTGSNPGLNYSTGDIPSSGLVNGISPNPFASRSAK